MTKNQTSVDAEGILNTLLTGSTVTVQLPDNHAADNLKKSLGKRYQRLQHAMQAAHYAALPDGSDVPYQDGGLSQKTIGYTADSSAGQYRFELRQKRSIGAFASKCYLVTQTEINPTEVSK
jgi:hypothetical protein